MNKGIVMEMNDANIIVMTSTGRFESLPRANRSCVIGEEISYAAGKARSKLVLRRGIVSGLIAAVVLCLVIFSGLTDMFANGKVVAYISIDINPSVEIGIDNQEFVRDLQGLNADGNDLIAAMSYDGKTLEEITAAILDKAEEGALSKGRGDIVISSTLIKSRSKINDESLADKLKLQVTKHIQDVHPAQVDNYEVASFAAPPEVREEAIVSGVSTGKYAVYLNALDNGTEVSLSDIQNLSIHQIAEDKGGISKLVDPAKPITKSTLQSMLKEEKSSKLSAEKAAQPDNEKSIKKAEEPKNKDSKSKDDKSKDNKNKDDKNKDNKNKDDKNKDDKSKDNKNKDDKNKDNKNKDDKNQNDKNKDKNSKDNKVDLGSFFNGNGNLKLNLYDKNQTDKNKDNKNNKNNDNKNKDDKNKNNKNNDNEDKKNNNKDNKNGSKTTTSKDNNGKKDDNSNKKQGNTPVIITASNKPSSTPDTGSKGNSNNKQKQNEKNTDKDKKKAQEKKEQEKKAQEKKEQEKKAQEKKEQEKKAQEKKEQAKKEQEKKAQENKKQEKKEQEKKESEKDKKKEQQKKDQEKEKQHKNNEHEKQSKTGLPKLKDASKNPMFDWYKI
ncbi:anti-sigma-I factor RsgI family protein [Paenibacillus eucommiae]|uniref:RsgI N-terminal anti-sigma domain-containing protein n=1 Tax=Paenibacillus eucommiae TaxID=1355755 RepID=A0ABS4J2U3_9BACL|nr:anti-sigma factor domain-containing protein [Paenibacillus eucommiae]MBP1993571.1 hypothetical protein [Paenibacillus eucommiae]